MKVGRKTAGGEAVMVIKVDQEIPEEVATKLEETKDIESVKTLNL